MALAYIADGDKIRLQSEWRERELAKEAGCRWDDEDRTWWTSLSWATCVMLRGVFGDRLQIAQNLSDWAATEIRERVEPCLRLRQSTDPIDTVYGAGRLEPLQTVAVEFAALARRALIGDGMGSGKTVEAICAVEEMALRYGEDQVFPCLVVSTNTMVYGWAEELAKWAPHRSTGVLKGGVAKRRALIERTRACPVHGVPQWPFTPSRRTSVGAATSALQGNEIQTSSSVSELAQSSGTAQSLAEDGIGELAGSTTFSGNTGCLLKITPGCYIVKDSSVLSAVSQSLSETDPTLSVSTIATRPDGSVVFSVSDATQRSSESSTSSGGDEEQECTCEDRLEFVVLNWEGLQSHTRVSGYGSIALNDKDKENKEFNESPPMTVIADEAHHAKNPQAKQTRAWWFVSWSAKNSLPMTGTPVTNSPEDLWSIMHGVEKSEWPSKTAWVERYGLKSWNVFGGLSVKSLRGDTQDELFKFLDPRFIRRPTNVVIPNIAEKLPPQIRYIDMTPKQAKAYKEMRKEMIALLDDQGFVMATDHLTQMTRMLQLSSAYLEVAEDGTFKMTSPSCKVDALMDIVGELDEDPLVAFAESRQLIELCAAKLEKESVPYGIITGEVSELQRAQYVQQFQAGELRVMLATMGAGGEGITLTKARHIVHLQRSFSLVKNRQSTDRVWRRGQDRPVQPIWVVTKNTAEEHVLDVGDERDATFEEIVRDEATLRKMLEL